MLVMVMLGVTGKLRWHEMVVDCWKYGGRDCRVSHWWSLVLALRGVTVLRSGPHPSLSASTRIAATADALFPGAIYKSYPY